VVAVVTRAHAIEALLLVTAGGVRWSSAWWQGGEVLERYDVTPHRDECPAGRHRFIAVGRGKSVARCAICGLRKPFVPLDARPLCATMVKECGVRRQCKTRAAPGYKLCWTHLHRRELGELAVDHDPAR
jgi:hypothetical protein